MQNTCCADFKRGFIAPQAMTFRRWAAPAPSSPRARGAEVVRVGEEGAAAAVAPPGDPIAGSWRTWSRAPPK